MKDYAREHVRDLLNNEANVNFIAKLYELGYCNVCGNYDYEENYEQNLDGTYKCSYCDGNVCEEEIVFDYDEDFGLDYELNDYCEMCGGFH